MNRGVSLGLTGYVLWGLSPIFWRLGQGSAGDILTLRILATALLLMSVHLVRDRMVGFRRAIARPGALRAMAASAALLSINWLVFIWAVNNERVLDASLGYFLNPLLSVILGVTVLGERMRSGQWFAVAVAAAGVTWLTVDLGTLPWVPLLLTASFGLYGLIRKTAPVGSLDGLTIELVAMAPVALIVLVVLSAGGDGVRTVEGIGGWAWVAGASLMTSVPLLLFASAARRVPLWMIGLLQYVTPTLQFLLGVWAYGEEWSGGQIVGYVVVWAALVVFAAEGVVHARRRGPAAPGSQDSSSAAARSQSFSSAPARSWAASWRFASRWTSSGRS